jgi:hypothetical protein
LLLSNFRGSVPEALFTLDLTGLKILEKATHGSLARTAIRCSISAWLTFSSCWGALEGAELEGLGVWDEAAGPTLPFAPLVLGPACACCLAMIEPKSKKRSMNVSVYRSLAEEQMDGDIQVDGWT